jgi:hypothetical protein
MLLREPASGRIAREGAELAPGFGLEYVNTHGI